MRYFSSTSVPVCLPMPTAPADSTLVSKCAAFDAFSAGKRPAGGNVVRGVRWSPDGSCLLTASEDCALRVFHLPSEVAHDAYATTCAAAEAERGDGSGGGDGAATASENGNGAVTGEGGGDSEEELRPALRIDEGESVYDYAWYPLMSAHDPMTCGSPLLPRAFATSLCPSKPLPSVTASATPRGHVR